MFAAWFFQVQYQWDGMQRYYLAHYVVSSAGLFQKYLVLHTVDRRGRWHPTVPAEVVRVQMASYPHGAIPFRLSEAALERGAVRLVNPVIPVDKARFAAFLRDWVYDGYTLTDLAKPGMWWGLGVMFVGLCFAWPQDRKARDILENGRRVRGAEMVTRDEFNRKRKYGIGMGFLTLEPRSVRERVWIKYSHGPMIFIPEEDEPKHFLLMGDTAGQHPETAEQFVRYQQARQYVNDAGETVKTMERRIRLEPSHSDIGARIVSRPFRPRAIRRDSPPNRRSALERKERCFGVPALTGRVTERSAGLRCARKVESAGYAIIDCITDPSRRRATTATRRRAYAGLGQVAYARWPSGCVRKPPAQHGAA